jgi:2'-5' RNA ligase
VKAPRVATSCDESGLVPPKRLRLFAAINLPDNVKTALDECQRGLASIITSASVRWTRHPHLTLKFLGDIEEGSASEIEMALSKSCRGIAPFQLSANGLGCFPTARSPRVIWAGIGGELAPLLALQKRINEETVKWAEPESREFTPHLTLARLKDLRRREAQTIAGFIEGNKRLEFGQWRVDQLDLMRSVLSREGAIYTCLGSIDLSQRSA